SLMCRALLHPPAYPLPFPPRRSSDLVGYALCGTRRNLADHRGQIEVAVSHEPATDRNSGPESCTQILGQLVTPQRFDKEGEAGQTIAVDLRADIRPITIDALRSEEHTSELQSREK